MAQQLSATHVTWCASANDQDVWFIHGLENTSDLVRCDADFVTRQMYDNESLRVGPNRLPPV